tara:strand:- start:130 stop:636 length:507 start_codon:yes stop_codon:yes gene_type:complete
VNDDLLLKKLKSEYQYLKAEKDLQQSIYEDAALKFHEHFAEKTKPPAPKPHKSKPKKKKIRPRKLNKLYKKLAQKIHPDKKTGNKDDFSELKRSIDENDMETLVDLATDYSINIEEDIDRVDFYESRIDALKEKLKWYSKTLVMQWFEMNENSRVQHEQRIIEILNKG